MAFAAKNRDYFKYEVPFCGLFKSRHGLTLIVFITSLLCNALAAYQVFGIPLPWLSNLVLIMLLFTICYNRKLHRFSGDSLLPLMIGWMISITIGNGDYSRLMPKSASTSYYVFITLRLLTVFVFIATIYIVYTLLINGYKNNVVRLIMIIASVLSLVAIYMYYAQLYGLPNIPTNRMGTGGSKEHIYRFTYAFHRATGTFREPSHLAQWLVVPFFLSFLYRKTIFDIKRILIATALLLTGSLTGILSSLLGVILGFFICNPFNLKNITSVIKIVIILGLALICFNFFAKSYSNNKANLIQVTIARVKPIISEGMTVSNRGYVFDYIANAEFSLFGSGVGNTNILFSRYLGNSLMSSLLSLYINFYLSIGLVGLIILMIFLLIPIIKLLLFRKVAQRSRHIFFIISAYIAWLVMFAIHAEELTVMSGIAYAFLIFEIKSCCTRRKSKNRKSILVTN